MTDKRLLRLLTAIHRGLCGIVKAIEDEINDLKAQLKP